MSERRPDFDALVGSDLDAAERERLLRVHELLIEAGPPPELSSPLPIPLHTRRRRRTALAAIAATLGAGILAVGVLVGNSGDGPGTFEVVTMTGTSYTTDLRASLTIFDVDDAGNWPMELEVEGLGPSSAGRYELWLTKGGKLAALCGSFLTEPDGSAVVPMNAPYKLKEFDGWVVVAEGSTSPLLTT
jgi:hypothetical protein